VDPLSKLPAELVPLWRAVHDRLSSGRPVSRVRVGPLDSRQQAALADLLGSGRMPGEYPAVSLSELDQILTESVGAGTREVVTRLIGPLADRAGDRKRSAEERTALWAWLDSHPVLAAQPALGPWAAAVRRAGVNGSAARTQEEIGQALRVIAELPASGDPLPVLADRVLGNTHALDDGTRLGGLVLRALAAIYDVAVPDNAQRRRALWEQAGVADGELSPVVLAAGIRPAGGDVAAQVMRLCADRGHAAALTLGQLKAAGDLGRLPAEAWVFENPSVLAMALARFGDRCPPIVVTSGWPNSAAVLLMQKLAAAGTRLYYHGDFDGEGLRIAAAVVARTGATPWHMTSADYLSAASQGPPVGRVSEVPWDTSLAGHLVRAGVTVAEERVAGSLLDELAGAVPLHTRP
jgi:uncharacterized protein (TIGR02679 family)